MKGFRKWLGQEPLFQKTTRCEIARIIIGCCSLSTAFHHQMVVVVQVCENCCVFTKPNVRSAWTKSQNGRRLSWAETDHAVLEEKRRYTVRYSRSVTCSLWTESVCKQHRVQLSTELIIWQGNWTAGVVSGIATPAKKGAADPPGSCKGDGNNV
jgi:hypothetical protein